jgi:hypothetical protein
MVTASNRGLQAVGDRRVIRAEMRFERRDAAERQEPFVAGVLQQLTQLLRHREHGPGIAWRSANTVNDCCATESGRSQAEWPPQR